MTALIDLVVAADTDVSTFLYRRVDTERIGAIGHSLGGYTVLGLAGGRASWREQRVRAVLGLSPYVAPYHQPHAELSVDVPAL
jgi:malonyl CoA-acyl carrier protein transacylase